MQEEFFIPCRHCEETGKCQNCTGTGTISDNLPCPLCDSQSGLCTICNGNKKINVSKIVFLAYQRIILAINSYCADLSTENSTTPTLDSCLKSINQEMSKLATATKTFQKLINSTNRFDDDAIADAAYDVTNSVLTLIFSVEMISSMVDSYAWNLPFIIPPEKPQ